MQPVVQTGHGHVGALAPGDAAAELDNAFKRLGAFASRFRVVAPVPVPTVPGPGAAAGTAAELGERPLSPTSPVVPAPAHDAGSGDGCGEHGMAAPNGEHVPPSSERAAEHEALVPPGPADDEHARWRDFWEESAARTEADGLPRAEAEMAADRDLIRAYRDTYPGTSRERAAAILSALLGFRL